MENMGIFDYHNSILEDYRGKENNGYLLSYKDKKDSEIFKVRFSRESGL